MMHAYVILVSSATRFKIRRLLDQNDQLRCYNHQEHVWKWEALFELIAVNMPRVVSLDNDRNEWWLRPKVFFVGECSLVY